MRKKGKVWCCAPGPTAWTKEERKKPKFLTTTELSARWIHHVQSGTLENWRSEGKGPIYVKLGDNRNAPIIYMLADIVAYEKKHRIIPEETPNGKIRNHNRGRAGRKS